MSSRDAEKESSEPLRRTLLEETTRRRMTSYPAVSDEVWRRERLYRYLYWREHHEHPDTNLVGSWTMPDLQHELARWNDYVRRDLSDEEVFDTLMAELEQRYGKTWVDALAEGTSPLLASVHMPIWSESTGALLPNRLGSMVITGAHRYENPDVGWSYYYGEPGVDHRLSIVLYDDGIKDLSGGTGDPRLKSVFEDSVRVIAELVAANGGTLLEDSFQGPVLETLTDPLGSEVEFVGFCVDVAEPSGTRRREAISVCVFRRHFMKVRYTVSFTGAPDALDLSCLEGINCDLARFVAFFR